MRGIGRKIKKSLKRSLSRNSSHKTLKTSQKPPQKNNTTTTRRYIACICSTVHAAEGKPPVLITASAEWHRRSGRCPQKTTVIIKTHCKAQSKRSRVRTAKEEGHESNKIAKERAKTSDDRYTFKLKRAGYAAMRSFTRRWNANKNESRIVRLSAETQP